MTSERVRPFFWLAAALLVGGCADFSRGAAGLGAADGSPDGGGSETGVVASDAVVSFSADVYPLLTSTCRSCHAPGQQAAGTRLLLTGDARSDYPVVILLVDTSAPAASRLLAKMAGNGHGGGTLYAVGTPEYQTVLRWIEEGALP